MERLVEVVSRASDFYFEAYFLFCSGTFKFVHCDV